MRMLPLLGIKLCLPDDSGQVRRGLSERVSDRSSFTPSDAMSFNSIVFRENMEIELSHGVKEPLFSSFSSWSRQEKAKKMELL